MADGQRCFAGRNTPHSGFYFVLVCVFAAPKSTQASAPFGLDFLCHTRSCVYYVFSFNLFPTWGLLSTALLLLLHRYHAPTITGIKDSCIGSPRISRPTTCNGLFHTFPAFHVPTILS